MFGFSKKNLKAAAKILIFAVGLCCMAACLAVNPAKLYASAEPVVAAADTVSSQADADLVLDAADNADPQANADAATDAAPVVVVLDPGHGGSNEGGQYGELSEKELTLKVAEAMKEELEKYENITVYLTRTEDVDMSLPERVRFAESVNADFLFCLHFNMSESHELYGAECWVSAYGEYYAKGCDFASIEMEMLTDLGLYNRGIKTRLRESGDADYYGIIRFSTAAQLPSVIIEHCHLDQPQDAAYIDTENWPKTYGILDATAVARYFGLASQELSVDYGGAVYSQTEVPVDTVLPDTTAPDSCMITGITTNEEDAAIQVDVSAQDAQSPMLYYAWSTDGGNTFSERYRWPTDAVSGAQAGTGGKTAAVQAGTGGETAEAQTESAAAATVSFEIPVSQAGTNELVVRVYNQYDLGTDSSAVDISLITEQLNAKIAGENSRGEEGAAEDASTETAIAQETERAGLSVFLAKADAVFPAWKTIAAIAAGMLVLSLAVILYQTKGGGNRLLCRGVIILILSAGILAGLFVGMLAALPGNATPAETRQDEMPETEKTEETFVELNFYYSELTEELKQTLGNDPAVIGDEELVYLHVLYCDFDGQTQEGELICNRGIAQDLVEIFEELYQANYPIEKICLIDVYDGDDEASMADDNSSCFNYRTIAGTDKISNHAYGLAVDINPLYNPYITGSDGNTVVSPKEGSAYADRSLDFPYKIDHEDLCYRLFTEHGFTWGGDWSGNKDYQHFEKKM
jgi:N-acetylmuramoyl-L-alanine amidase